MRIGRRQWLGGSVALLASRQAWTTAARAADAVTTTQHFALDIGGTLAGTVASISGGNALSGVVTPEMVGPNPILKKRIGHVPYSDIAVAVGAGMGKNLFDWIRASFVGPMTRDGALLFVDQSSNIVDRRVFLDAFLTQMSFPALERGSKDVRRIGVQMSPDQVRQSAASGKLPTLTGTQQKDITATCYHANIAGLETACAAIAKVSQITVGFGVQPVISPIVLTMDSAAASAFTADAVRGKDLVLELRTPDMQRTIYTLTCRSIALTKVGPAPSGSASQVELSAQGAAFDYTLIFA